ncbi:hypothetical protein LTR60_006769 [Cryomyces antarcticus]|nr:hypothetical protein LTR60_006769 [Cryomyces antarcticus]
MASQAQVAAYGLRLAALAPLGRDELICQRCLWGLQNNGQGDICVLSGNARRCDRCSGSNKQCVRLHMSFNRVLRHLGAMVLRTPRAPDAEIQTFARGIWNLWTVYKRVNPEWETVRPADSLAWADIAVTLRVQNGLDLSTAMPEVQHVDDDSDATFVALD